MGCVSARCKGLHSVQQVRLQLAQCGTLTVLLFAVCDESQHCICVCLHGIPTGIIDLAFIS
jgi:hypothetical protein